MCRRCGESLEDALIVEAAPVISRKRKIILRLLLTPALIIIILLIAYLSLLATSDPINFEQRQAVTRAINIIEQKGFGREAFMLRRAVSFRATDNWWNRWVGHDDAYAATNFPFQVVTLYPDFFAVPVDDVERAAILLHESYHLYGSGEEEAFKGVWREKKRLGWTRATHGESRVWKNVSESTGYFAPQFFRCGLDGRSDCFE
jgi:hypothetical protein